MSSATQRTLPNAITIARLVGAAGFFAVLALALSPTDATDRQAWGNVAVALFAVSAASDALDGYLARRWGVVTDFGRIMDPFVDKVLVLGAFVYLASPKFAEPSWSLSWEIPAPHASINCATGVASWMVVVMLARELFVTSMRSVLEARGVAFGADLTGKIKMVAQSVLIPVVLFVSVNRWALASEDWRTIQAIAVWAMVLITVGSAVPYVIRGSRLLKQIAGESNRGVG
ncbi:MAG: CDP-alcohol phosphatidyltransferase family protein [Phycisphaerae bacterium]|nr:CDP-alcohol phosphatidyltransferase family protein [Phycisphaerae bacterium]